MECTHCNLNYSLMPALALQLIALLYKNYALCCECLGGELRSNFNYKPQVEIRCTRVVTPAKKLNLPLCGRTAASSVKQHKPSSSCRALTSRPPSIEVMTGISLTSAGKPHFLNVCGEGMLQPQQTPLFLPTFPLAARA